ncbi:MAG TPA: hypothetical protein PLF22_09940 [Pseudomonadales bacterium]|nr:hypothetical protein [Pseudomonadales bacterium]
MIGLSNLNKRHRFLIAGTAHSGLSVVTKDGDPAVLAVLDAEGNIIEAGEHVADTAWEAMVAIYKNFLQGNGHLLVKKAPPDLGIKDDNVIETPSIKMTKKMRPNKHACSQKTAINLAFGDFKSHIQRFITGDDVNTLGKTLKYNDPSSKDYFGFSHSFIKNDQFIFTSCCYADMAYDTNSRFS